MSPRTQHLNFTKLWLKFLLQIATSQYLDGHPGKVEDIMSLKKILMKGTTRMSLHERFTFLRNQTTSEPQQTVRPRLFADQQASLENRRLAQVMERRPTVMAALKAKKRILKQRLGQLPRAGLSVKDRLSLRGRGGLRGRVGQRNSVGRSPLVRLRGNRGNRRGGSRGNLSRSQSMTNLARSQSMQSLGVRRNNSLSSGGGRGGRFQNRNTFRNQEFRRGGGVGGRGVGGRGRGLRSRGGGFNRNRDDFRSRRGGGSGRFNNRNQRSRGFRGRGGGGGGRGRGGRGGQMPTKEELDSQLDQYMASSRGVLDRQLDSYMSNTESWD